MKTKDKYRDERLNKPAKAQRGLDLFLKTPNLSSALKDKLIQLRDHVASRKYKKELSERPEIIIMNSNTRRSLLDSTIEFVDYLNMNIDDKAKRKEIFEILYKLIEQRLYYSNLPAADPREETDFSSAEKAVEIINKKIGGLNRSIHPVITYPNSGFGGQQILLYDNKYPKKDEFQAYLLLSEFLKTMDFHRLKRCAFQVEGLKSCKKLFFDTNETTKHCSSKCRKDHSRFS